MLLSRFARAKAGDTVADFCAGSGIVAFHFYALHRAVKGLSFTLFEMQEELSLLSEKTAALNGFDNFDFFRGRIQDIPDEYREKFSLVLCNPPYERGGLENDDYKKAICRKEITVTLGEIARAASKALKFGGRIALTNRADRLAEVCYTFREAGIEIKPGAVCGGQGRDEAVSTARGGREGRSSRNGDTARARQSKSRDARRNKRGEKQMRFAFLILGNFDAARDRAQIAAARGYRRGVRRRAAALPRRGRVYRTVRRVRRRGREKGDRRDGK